ncbi:MAG: sigma-70 family RNA polymerase sigma factor [Saprospiraceae bacterium]|nr:sigma-70 family RNA polymerase sigma factor [Saprospiraceae bacterium]MBP6565855.1 sigma-70 family RNA polymerase sigma factor [Saprospiraceae bacterium]
MSYVKNNKGQNDEGIMLFHDSVVAFVKKVFSDIGFELTTSIDAYIFGIARILWMENLRKNKRNPLQQSKSIDGLHEIVSDDFIRFDSTEKMKILEELMNHLRSNCKQVLMYWAGGYNMSEIAQLVGYKSEGMARKKKCECYKELIVWLEAHPEYLNELKN